MPLIDDDPAFDPEDYDDLEEDLSLDDEDEDDEDLEFFDDEEDIA